MRSKVLFCLGGIGLLGAALLIGGCDDKDVAAPTVAPVSAECVDAVDLAFETPVLLDVETSNGAVIVRGVAGIQTISVTVTLGNRGRTREEA